MRDAYRSEVEAARARSEELEAQVAARDAELAILREKAVRIEGVLERLQSIVDDREKPVAPKPRRLVHGMVIAALGIAVGAIGAATARARPAIAAPIAASVAPAPSTAPSTSESSRVAARTSVEGKPALATPNAGSGWLDVAVSDHELSCKTNAEPRGRDGACPTSWRLRLSLPPEHRDVGVHRMGAGAVFAYVDRQQSVAYGGPEPGATCRHNGSGDVTGTVEVLSATAEEVVLRLDTDQFEGVVHANVCGACKSTGLTCSSNAECCAHFCGDGRCRP